MDLNLHTPTSTDLDLQLDEAVQLGNPDDAPEPRQDSRNVTVTYGIHKGRYPIGGLRIHEARQVLNGLIHIDESAIPVINGRPVDPDQRIDERVTMIAFVKPSAIKG